MTIDATAIRPFEPAPGRPGVAPTWTSSAKDMVTSALGPSRVWVTLGHGIINEVYWPSAGRPQIRDLGFIVAGRSKWHEVKRIARYQLSLPEPFIPVPHIIHEGEGYRLELEVSPDPLRDAIVIAFRLTGDDMALYVLLAPHLDGSGTHNNARADGDLRAWKDCNALYLTSDCGFSRTSAGYVGYSDGWQDFCRNGSMRWTFSEALDGNVALMGELASREGVLALAFADSPEGARTLARSSLHQGFEAVRSSFIAQWETWAKDLSIPDAPEEIRREAYLSAMVLKVHQGRTYPGAVVASLSVPWGNTTDNPGGYHLVWMRDAIEVGLGLLSVGQLDDARRMLIYAMATQRADGCWSQNGFPDGRPYWTGVQLDEVGFPILFAAKLKEAGGLDGLVGVAAMIRRAAGYLVRNGPISPQDRWEENPGISPFTLGIEIAALVAAADHLSAEEALYALSLADYWNERLEDWTYVQGGAFIEEFGVEGYYVRVAPAMLEGGLCGRVDVRNRGGESIAAIALIGMEYLYLPRLGLRDPRDPRIQNTLKISESILRVETPHGIAYHRYNEDGYGERPDGSPFNGSGVGRAWPLLTGERGYLDVLLGIDPLPYLEMMTRMTSPGGLIPEQVWDGPAMPERGLEPGKPTGSAMPLVWAHAEFLNLLAARHDKRPPKLLACVERRYQAQRPMAATWHWRRTEAFEQLPSGRDLLIESSSPFQLHHGYDGWRDVTDKPSEPQEFGMHGVRLNAAVLSRRSAIDFTLYYTESNSWEGMDHRISLQPIG
jgi:glucoamylase